MFWQELCHIICFAMDYHPAILLGAMLGNLGAGQGHLEEMDVVEVAAGFSNNTEVPDDMQLCNNNDAISRQ